MAETIHSLRVDLPDGEFFIATIHDHKDGTGNHCAFIHISLASPSRYGDDPSTMLNKLGVDLANASIACFRTTTGGV